MDESGYNLDTYIAKLQQDFTYGGAIEIICMCNIFNIKINLYRTRNNGYLHTIQSLEEFLPQGYEHTTLPTITLILNGDNHFDVLIPITSGGKKINKRKKSKKNKTRRKNQKTKKRKQTKTRRKKTKRI